jgi:hypothetical protein
MKNLTREEAIRLSSIETVEKVEGLPCTPTNSVTDGKSVTDGTIYDGHVEFVSSVELPSEGFGNRYLNAYYYLTKDDWENLSEYELEDKWEIDHYRLIN